MSDIKLEATYWADHPSDSFDGVYEQAVMHENFGCRGFSEFIKLDKESSVILKNRLPPYSAFICLNTNEDVILIPATEFLKIYTDSAPKISEDPMIVDKSKESKAPAAPISKKAEDGMSSSTFYASKAEKIPGYKDSIKALEEQAARDREALELQAKKELEDKNRPVKVKVVCDPFGKPIVH